MGAVGTVTQCELRVCEGHDDDDGDDVELESAGILFDPLYTER